MQLAKLTKNLVDTALLLEETAEQFRDYLGMSSLGHSCMRQLWYGFRLFHVDHPLPTGRVLRLWNRGHREEPYVCARLEAAGITVVPVNPVTGKQFRYVGSYGHAKGHSDGLVYNLPEIQERWALFECKTHNDRNFTALSNRGVAKAFPMHYCQIQRYMERHRAMYPELNLEHALYVGVSKNNDDWHTEIVPFNQEDADMLINREMSVIESEGPPRKLTESPEFFTCRFCDYNHQCHGLAKPPVHCRTCEHVAVHDNGVWQCERPFDKERFGPLTLVEQLEGCGGYVKSSYL